MSAKNTSKPTKKQTLYDPSCRDPNNPEADHQASSPGFTRVAQTVKETLSPSSILDLSLDPKPWVKAFKDVGIPAYSFPSSESSDPNVREGSERSGDPAFLPQPFPSHFPKRYDLITCFERFSSLSEEEASTSIRHMVQYSDTLLFSFTPYDLNRPDRSRLKPPEYWVSLFENASFTPDITYDASYISPHALLFRKRKHLDYPLPRPLRLLVLSSQSENACCEVRIFKPLSCLQTMGRVELRIFPAKTKQPPALEHLDWADMFILQRIKSLKWRSYVKHAKKKGIPVLFEIDDNLFELPKQHPEFSSRIDTALKNSKYAWFIRHADAVTASTRPLASYLRKFNPNVHVLRNYVAPPTVPHRPESTYTASKKQTIGYTGTYSHAHDLQPIVQSLKRINERFHDTIRFLFLGYAPPELALECNFSFDGRVLPYPYFLSELFQKEIDIGLAPLHPNFFNCCKSNIKFLEYALAGIPGLYSNVGPYADSVLHGDTGFLVEENTQEHWFEALHHVLQNPETLQKARSRAYEFVQNYFLLKDHFREWWDVYMDVILRTRGGLT